MRGLVAVWTGRVSWVVIQRAHKQKSVECMTRIMQSTRHESQ